MALLVDRARRFHPGDACSLEDGHNSGCTWQELLTYWPDPVVELPDDELHFTETLAGAWFWSFLGFNGINTQAQTALGWMYPVLNGDNAWVDIALHLGAAGVVVFTLILIRFGVYAFRPLKRQHDMLAFFPAGLLLFVVISNISVSLFLELEFLTWLMLISTQSTVLLSQFQEKPLRTEKTSIERIEI